MKNNMKLIALAMAGLMSIPALAQESEQTSLIDTAKVKRDAQMHSELSTEVSLLQLQLKRATLQQQIAESQAAVKSLNETSEESEEIKKVKELYEEELNAKDEEIKKLQEEKKALSTRKTGERKKTEKHASLDSIYLTSIKGLGNNLTAQFYINNNIVRSKKGGMIAEGVVVEDISPNGVLLRSNKTTKTLSVTTIEQAHFSVSKAGAPSQGMGAETPNN